MSELLPHQERAVEERDQLAQRHVKLQAFLNTRDTKETQEEEFLLLHRQFECMTDYLDILDRRVRLFLNQKAYKSTSRVLARPMKREDYNILRGWDLPADEDGADEGYLLERLNSDYITWTPKATFEAEYEEIRQ